VHVALLLVGAVLLASFQPSTEHGCCVAAAGCRETPRARGVGGTTKSPRPAPATGLPGTDSQFCAFAGSLRLANAKHRFR
jgi:hypothetical protein